MEAREAERQKILEAQLQKQKELEMQLEQQHTKNKLAVLEKKNEQLAKQIVEEKLVEQKRLQDEEEFQKVQEAKIIK